MRAKNGEMKQFRLPRLGHCAEVERGKGHILGSHPSSCRLYVLMLLQRFSFILSPIQG